MSIKTAGVGHFAIPTAPASPSLDEQIAYKNYYLDLLEERRIELLDAEISRWMNEIRQKRNTRIAFLLLMD